MAKQAEKETDFDPTGEVHLDKMGKPGFEDEWDFMIYNYTVGANDTEMIDSIRTIAERTDIEDESCKNFPGRKTGHHFPSSCKKS